MNITISKELKSITPNFHVGVMISNVKVYKNNELDTLVSQIENQISTEIDISDVVNLEIIKDGRDAYKSYGKDPSRYRLAVESLFRRLSKGNKLYRINNIVDLGNILSILTRKSIAVLDCDKIDGDIEIRLGKENEEYYGIGRGKLNIENIPLYEDKLGAFGSVTSDTERTMITQDTKRVLIFVISFSGNEVLNKDLEVAIELFSKYGNASEITTFSI